MMNKTPPVSIRLIHQASSPHSTPNHAKETCLPSPSTGLSRPESTPTSHYSSSSFPPRPVSQLALQAFSPSLPWVLPWARWDPLRASPSPSSHLQPWPASPSSPLAQPSLSSLSVPSFPWALQQRPWVSLSTSSPPSPARVLPSLCACCQGIWRQVWLWLVWFRALPQRRCLLFLWYRWRHQRLFLQH